MGDKPKKPLEEITLDFFISKGMKSGGVQSTGGQLEMKNAGLVIKDRATGFKRSFPSGTRSKQETKQAFMKFAGKGKKPQRAYFDNAPEFVESAKELGWMYDTSTPERSETNGIAERDMQDVRQGATSALLEAGCYPEHWPHASMHYCTSDAIEPQAPYLELSLNPNLGSILPCHASKCDRDGCN